MATQGHGLFGRVLAVCINLSSIVWTPSTSAKTCTHAYLKPSAGSRGQCASGVYSSGGLSQPMSSIQIQGQTLIKKKKNQKNKEKILQN